MNEGILFNIIVDLLFWPSIDIRLQCSDDGKYDFLKVL
jgi:hypothetical protein